MRRLWCQTGKPTLLEQHELSLKYLLDHTAHEDAQPDAEHYISTYIVETKIIQVNKHLHFLLIVVKDNATHTNRNTNDAIDHIITVDNITLEVYVKYQQIDCDIIRGYK